MTKTETIPELSNYQFPKALYYFLKYYLAEYVVEFSLENVAMSY
jgi:hypothetical protein